MLLKASHFIVWLFVCIITLSYGQYRPVDLCNNDGVYSCICDESTNVKNSHRIRVMCSFQNIEDITDKMIIPNNTDSLDFSVNNISVLTYRRMFDNLNILVFHLNRNQIRIIDSETFVDLTNLIELDLSENRIENLEPRVFDGLYHLKKLYLYSNKLTSLNHYIFQGLPQLELLSLSENNLGNFLVNLPDIFSPQGISLTPNIETLYLNNINMNYTPPNLFDSAYNMRALYLKNNPIKEFPKLPFTLEILDISGTSISSLAQANFLNLPAIKYLYMNDLENLTAIEKYAFIPMKGLNSIELQNCKKLQYLDVNTFGIISNNSDFDFPIANINLMGSGLRTLDEGLLPFFSKLSTLDLRSNPWVCDCKLKWLLSLQLNDETKQETRCDRPPNLQGKTLYSLKPKDLECKTWNKVIDNVTRITLVILCIGLGALAIWLVVLWPPQGMRTRPPMRRVGPDSPYSRITIQPVTMDNEL